MKLRLAEDEVAVFPKKRGSLSAAKAAALTGGGRLEFANPAFTRVKLEKPLGGAERRTRMNGIAAKPGISGATAVFYRGEKKDENRYILTGQILVHFKEPRSNPEAEAWGRGEGLELVKAFSYGNAFLFEAGPGSESLEAADRIARSDEVLHSYPNWIRPRFPRAVDPLFGDQWHLENTGQSGGVPWEDANITNIWNTYTGAGSVIAIVDDGLDIYHEDLSGNVVPGLGYDWVDLDTDPTAGEHGTSCAGVAAAVGDNGIGVKGAAPAAGLVGHHLLGNQTDQNEAEASTRDSDQIHIYSNSWGPTDDGQRLEGPAALMEGALLSGVNFGRGGLGNIYVWAAGNGLAADDNSNYDGYANSRYTIAVSATNDSGVQSPYSEPGANLIVNAPSDGGASAITTTDRTGDTVGYSTANGYADPNYTNDFGGTSSSAPLVSGVVALMLEANPALTWRDVQHVLATTAEKNAPTDSGWSRNGAGYNVSHKYGFGRVNAEAAVNAALAWNSATAEVSDSGTSAPGVAIPDDDAIGVSDVITIADSFVVEYVDVIFNSTDHTYWGDLRIVLTSPEGTQSVLSELHNGGAGPTWTNWRFGSARHFGEGSAGNWTLTVSDLAAADVGTFEDWTLVVYGANSADWATDSTSPASFALVAPSEGLETNAVAIRFEWEESSDSFSPVSYRLIVDTDMAGNLLADTTLWDTSATLTFPANDTYFWRVAAIDARGNATISSDSFLVIDTTPPSTPLLVSPVDGETTFTSILLDWDSATDALSGLRRYRVQVDTGGVFADGSMMADSYGSSPDTWVYLSAGTWYWRVITEDDAGNTAASSPESFVVQGPDTGEPVFLSASASPSSVANDGYETVVFTVVVADSNAVVAVVMNLLPVSGADSTAMTENPAGTWTDTHVFDTTVAGADYDLVVTAFDVDGNRVSTTIAVSVSDPSPSVASLADTSLSGQRISGEEVTLTSTWGDTYQEVRYEYRPVNGSWTFIARDTEGPFWSVYWDVTGLSDGIYDVRAVGVDLLGNVDTNPSHARVIVDNSNPTMIEFTDSRNALHTLRKFATPDSAFFLALTDTEFLAVLTLSMETGAVDDSTWIRAVIMDTVPDTASIPTWIRAGANPTIVNFSREDGGRLFQSPVTITLPYDDADFGLLEERLQVFYFDDVLELWVKVPGAVVDTERNLITVASGHFTIFMPALGGSPVAANLQSLVVYPNPFIPNDGNARTGASFSQNVAGTGITFDGLPASVDIIVYDLNGRRVAVMTKRDGATGTYQWDARNDEGRALASGVYFAVITSTSGERVIKKLMVIR